MERVQRQLSSDAFSTFRAVSASFMQGKLSAKQLHQRITQLGVAAVVPDMAALCPDAGDWAWPGVICAGYGSTASCLQRAGCLQLTLTWHNRSPLSHDRPAYVLR